MAEPILDESSLSYRGWRVVAVCFLLAVFAWGFAFYGHSVFLAELQRLHGWPVVVISAASTLAYLVSAALVIFVNDAFRIFGLRLPVMTGVISMAIAGAGVGMVTSPWQLYAAYLLMSLGWATMTIAAISNLVGLWFDEKRGLAISLALNGASASGVIIVPLMVLLIERVGFQRAMLVSAGTMLVVLVPAVLFWIGPPPAKVRKAAAAVTPEWTRMQALRSPAFWSVTGPFAIAMAAQAGFLVHQFNILRETMEAAPASLAIAIASAMAIAGRLVMGFFVDRLDKRLTSALSMASQAIALLVLVSTPDMAVRFAACAVYGFSVGNLITLPSLIVQQEFDPRMFGMLTALVTAVTQVIFAMGPSLLGALRDAAGSYTWPLVLCAGLTAFAGVAVLWRPRVA